MSKQYRLTWAASSNISFHGATEWEDWFGDDDDSEESIEEELVKGQICEGLSQVLEASGFEWNIETREASQ